MRQDVVSVPRSANVPTADVALAARLAEDGSSLSIGEPLPTRLPIRSLALLPQAVQSDQAIAKRHVI
jgi:hypothetical protein